MYMEKDIEDRQTATQAKNNISYVAGKNNKHKQSSKHTGVFLCGASLDPSHQWP